MPYSLLKDENIIDKGYLLSPRDLCSLELLPELIASGVDSLKIEGRMKAPEYVATVTRIYRKYIDKIFNNENYIIEEQDKKDLLQVFNRGGFSSGHLLNEPNKELIFKEKPNNMGIYIGNVSNYNANKGHITLSLNESISIGDTITFQNENTKYTISELMIGNKNLTTCDSPNKVTIGRMKGNIKPGDKVFRLASKELSSRTKQSYITENIKNPIKAKLNVNLNKPLTLKIFDNNNNEVTVESNEIVVQALKTPITQERLEKQLNKLGDSPFYFSNIEINLDNNVFVPHISTINELRRNAINKYEEILINKYKRTIPHIQSIAFNNKETLNKNKKISVLLNNLNLDFNYLELKNIDKLYIPLRYFHLNSYSSLLKILTDSFNVYIYMPSIIKPNYRNLFKDTISNSLKQYKIKGFVISNIGNLKLLEEYKNDFEFIGNYTLNVFNNKSKDFLGINTLTISPELNKGEINNIASNSKDATEFIVYGNLPLMTSNYCLLGKSNKCYPDCKQQCKENNKYYLKDRMNFTFRIIPDNIQTISTIYNSKITCVDTTELNVDNYRIDILDEDIEEINNIITTIKEHKRLEGNNYTNGNFNRIV